MEYWKRLGRQECLAPALPESPVYAAVCAWANIKADGRGVVAIRHQCFFQLRGAIHQSKIIAPFFLNADDHLLHLLRATIKTLWPQIRIDALVVSGSKLQTMAEDQFAFLWQKPMRTK
jgi:hypothetical protein